MTTAQRLRRLLLGAVVALSGLAPLGPATAVPAGAAPDVAPWLARRPLNIAHAGGDLESPHETMYAYEEAVAAGTDVLEMDLRLSADGELMVVHDDTVDRTTGATGLVRDRTAAELQALDNAYWFVPDCWSCHDRPASDYAFRGVRTGAVAPPAGHTADDFAIPTFQQVLDRFPDRLLDVEIKDGPDGMAAAERLAAVLNGSARGTRVVVVSFDDAILAHFRALAPDVATSPGLGETTDWFLGTRGELPGQAAVQVPPVFSGLDIVTQQMVDDAHASRLAVWVWFNGNDDDVASEWNRLLDLGVDGLITGKPRQLQAVLDARDASFRTPLDVGPRAYARRGDLRVPVACPALAADRCFALVAIRVRGEIVGGMVADLAPGQRRWYSVDADRRSWRRHGGRDLSFQAWGANADTASSQGPLTLR